jgi:hypothetical protein
MLKKLTSLLENAVNNLPAIYADLYEMESGFE